MRDVLSSVLHSAHMLRHDVTLCGQDRAGLGDTAKGQSRRPLKKLPDTVAESFLPETTQGAGARMVSSQRRP